MKTFDIELKEFLEEKVLKFNQASFIENDPISIPHQFKNKEDIEISGFLTAVIAWGQRKTIIRNANLLMKLMEYDPAHFIKYANKKELVRFENFVHRTFNGTDCIFFMKTLMNIYRNKGGLHNIFSTEIANGKTIKDGLIRFREIFFETEHPIRSRKHISDITKNSSAKRLNMFLRWMVRDDKKVDFGIWNDIPPSQLYLPLDIHTGTVSRKLELLERKQNDWKAVEELSLKLKLLDPIDPIKYDFALFGLGAIENF